LTEQTYIKEVVTKEQFGTLRVTISILRIRRKPLIYKKKKKKKKKKDIMFQMFHCFNRYVYSIRNTTEKEAHYYYYCICLCREKAGTLVTFT